MSGQTTTVTLVGVLGLLVGACAPSTPDATSFAVTSPVETTQGSTSTGQSSTPESTSGGASVPASASSEAAGSSTTGVQWDLGTKPDVGSNTPPGCKGKVDFLFAISRDSSMALAQKQLIASFEPFIASIQALGAEFENFDFHIMVVDGDNYWGQPACEDSCELDGLCQFSPDYPCDYKVSVCDAALGAGTIYNAGDGSSNKSCGLAAGKRYLDRNNWDLNEAFACIAQVGTDGWEQNLGGAIDAAVTTQRDACNTGFLRDDALLVVTYIKVAQVNGLKEYPVQWMLRLVDAKGGDPNAIVMLGVSQWNDIESCLDDADDWLCDLLVMLPHHVYEYVKAPSFGPAFEQTVDLIDVACSEFIPG